MYRGKNPTALQSQKWLQESLVELCITKPYNKITIKELCLNADLSRQTFYTLFDSKDEIIELFIEGYFDKMISEMDSFDDVSINSLLHLGFSLYKNDPIFGKILVDNNLVWILRKKIQEQIHRLAALIGFDKVQGDTLNYAAAFVAGAIIEVIIYLFNNNIQKTNDEISELILSLLKGEYLEEFGLMPSSGKL